MEKRLKTKIAALVIAGLLIPAAGFAMPWSWDMFDQLSHKAQEEPYPAIPEGSVTVGADPVIKDREAAAKIKNPIPMTEASIKRGQDRYEVYCLTCHGATGLGDGPVGAKFAATVMPPTDLTTDYVLGKPDGDIFYTIKYGGLAFMPLYGDSVTPEDRWHIVNYLKATFGKKAPPAAPVKK